MNDKDKILDLLEQIIEHQEAVDKVKRKEAIYKMKFDKASGESFTLHHIKILKTLIKDG